MMNISELRHKDVIDNSDGRRLGYIRDIEIDVTRGGVEAIVVPEEGRLFGLFRRSEERIVPWSQISKIGVDVILVEAEPRLRPRGERTDAGAERSPAPALIADEFDDMDFFRFD